MKKRKLTAAEKQQRRFERGALRKNAKLQAEVPLFAHLEPAVTPEDERLRWRRNVALAAENSHGFIVQGEVRGVDLWQDLQVCHIRRIARLLLDARSFTLLHQKCQQTYPTSIYWKGFWRRALTGEHIELMWGRVENRQPGQPAIVCTEAYQRQVMTGEEFDTLFPGPSLPKDQPEDGGLAERVEAFFSPHMKQE